MSSCEETTILSDALLNDKFRRKPFLPDGPLAFCLSDDRIKMPTMPITAIVTPAIAPPLSLADFLLLDVSGPIVFVLAQLLVAEAKFVDARVTAVTKDRGMAGVVTTPNGKVGIFVIDATFGMPELRLGVAVAVTEVVMPESLVKAILAPRSSVATASSKVFSACLGMPSGLNRSLFKRSSPPPALAGSSRKVRIGEDSSVSVRYSVVVGK